MFALATLNLSSSFRQNSLLGVVHLAKLIEVDVRSLDNLDLSDLHVLDGVNRGDFFGDLLLDGLTGEQVEDLGNVGFADLLSNDVVDSLADDLLLGRKGIIGLSLLVRRLAGEGDDEDSQDISVLGLDVRNSFDEGFSLLDEGAELISGGVDSVEGSDGLPAFSLINNKANLSPVEAVLVGSQIGLHLRHDSALDAIFDLF